MHIQIPGLIKIEEMSLRMHIQIPGSFLTVSFQYKSSFFKKECLRLHWIMGVMCAICVRRNGLTGPQNLSLCAGF